MKSRNEEMDQANEKADADLRFIQATGSQNYALVTQLIDQGLIDPNEIIDARKRIYGSKNYRVSVYPNETTHKLQWCISRLDYNDSYPEKSTILHQAIAEKNVPLVNAILASNKTNPNQKSERGYTPLHYGAIVGNPIIVKHLIKRGADSTLTCNGFKPSELVLENNIPVKKLLYSMSKGDLFLSLLPNFLVTYLLKQTECMHQDSSYPGSSSQFGILSKMRAMRERDEVIYANDTGVCSGVAHIAMFYILSNKRDEQGSIIGQLELEYILRQMIISSTEDFIEKIELREYERLQVYKRVCDIIDELDDNAIATESEDLLRSVDIDVELFTKAKLPSEKKSLLIKTKFKLQMAIHFSKHALIELGFRSFTDAVEILQKIDTHPELQRKQQPIEIRMPNAVFPLLMTAELEELGGLSKSITFSSVFLQKNTENNNELEVYFKCLRDKFENMTFPISLQLDSNAHGISIFYDPIKKYWILIDINGDNPSQPIVTTSDNTEIANHVYNSLKFGHEGKQGSNLLKPYLIMSAEIYTAKQYETKLEQQISLLNDNEEFQALFNVTPFKASATDKRNRIWLDYAGQYGQVETVRMLHQQHVFEKRVPAIDIYYAEYMAKTREQYACYYQQDGNKNYYTYRYELLKLAYDLNKLITIESISSKEHERLKHKFILEVLENTPIGNCGVEDEANISLSVLSCYAQWIYQGRAVSTLLSDVKLADLIQRAMTNHTDFVNNVNNLFTEDSTLAIHIRQAIHELEKAPSDEESIAFLSNCLITAGQLATANALNNIPGGVLNKAIEDIYKQLEDQGSVPSEKIQSTLNSVVFFKTIDASTAKDSTLDNMVRNQAALEV